MKSGSSCDEQRWAVPISQCHYDASLFMSPSFTVSLDLYELPSAMREMV